jgi:hypothetical protein
VPCSDFTATTVTFDGTETFDDRAAPNDSASTVFTNQKPEHGNAPEQSHCAEHECLTKIP